jgi:predicted HicB family RNase H-like nuclease
MEYKGYTARVEFDQDAGILFGEVEGLRDVVTFEATDVSGLEKAFRESVDDYLAMCAERGEDPEKPYSGKFIVRVDPKLHRDIATAAARAGKSLNAFTSEVLDEWVARSSQRPLSDSGKWRVYLQSAPDANANASNLTDQTSARAPRAPAVVAESMPPPTGFWPVSGSRTPGSLTPNTPAGSDTPQRSSQRMIA